MILAGGETQPDVERVDVRVNTYIGTRTYTLTHAHTHTQTHAHVVACMHLPFSSSVVYFSEDNIHFIDRWTN